MKKLYAGAVMANPLHESRVAWCPYCVLAIDKNQAIGLGLAFARKHYPSAQFEDWSCDVVEIPQNMIDQTL